MLALFFRDLRQPSQVFKFPKHVLGQREAFGPRGLSEGIVHIIRRITVCSTLVMGDQIPMTRRMPSVILESA